MYYSLIDDLAFLQNSLPPYNGAATFVGNIFTNGTLPIRLQGLHRRTPVYSPQGIQPDAKTPAVQEWNLTIEQQLSTEHFAARCLCRIVRRA